MRREAISSRQKLGVYMSYRAESRTFWGVLQSNNFLIATLILILYYMQVFFLESWVRWDSFSEVIEKGLFFCSYNNKKYIGLAEGREIYENAKKYAA